jgi:hypothetical protein
LRTTRRRTRGRTATHAIALATALATTGCVERYLVIDSNPTGARVVINGQPQQVIVDGKPQDAVTPMVFKFDHYGTFRFDAWLPEKPATTQWVEVDTPWWQWFPLDLFSELFSPATHVDRRQVMLTFADEPSPAPAERDVLLERAAALRRETQ